MGPEGEGGEWGLNAPRKSQSYTEKKNKATKSALNVGSLFCWQANDSLLSIVVGSSLSSVRSWLDRRILWKITKLPSQH